MQSEKQPLIDDPVIDIGSAGHKEQICNLISLGPDNLFAETSTFLSCKMAEIYAASVCSENIKK